MKLVKLSVFALTMGLFVASCGNGSDTAKTTDSTSAATTTSATTAPAAPATMDTTKPAAMDTTKPAAAPATTETKMEKKESKMTETKKK